MKKTSSITAFIMAGGRSSRMGTDKGLMLFQGQQMIQFPITVLSSCFEEVVIIANDPSYTKFNLPVYSDLEVSTGPIGGILTALTYTTTPWNFILACDMPFVNRSVIGMLSEKCDSADAIVPVYENHSEPLCALYNKSCMPLVRQQIANGNFKLQVLLKSLNIQTVDFTGKYSSDQHPFRNMNTMDEIKNVTKAWN